MAKLSPVLNWQIVDDEGKPLNGGKIETYLTGSSTPATTFTDSAGTIPHSNPIILNTRGEVPGLIWLDDDLFYKFMLFDADNNLIDTLDGISGISDIQPVFSEWVTIITSFTYIDDTTFSVPGDQTETFVNKRRIKAQVTAGTVYGTIIESEFNGTITTVKAILDSGDLDAGLINVQVGFLTSKNTSIPSLIEDFKKTVITHETDTPLWESVAKIQNWTGAPEIENFPVAPQPGAWRIVSPEVGTKFKHNAHINLKAGKDYTSEAGDIFIVIANEIDSFEVITINSLYEGQASLSKLDRTGAAGKILTAHGVDQAPTWEDNLRLGVGQTWQDLKASRALATTYTNSTGKPIAVAMSSGGGSAITHQLLIDGVVVQQSNNGVSVIASLFGIVPNGSTYRINGSSLDTWAELR